MIRRILKVLGKVTVLVILCILAVLILALYIKIETKEYIYQNVENVPEALVAIVPGAAILKNGDISSVLKDRADKAVELYRANKVSKILVSGDNSTQFYNEVNPVRNYLLTKNVREEDIFLDHAGFDTYSSMYRARDIFLTEDPIIVTQAFHLPRAVFIARHLGLEAVGYTADQGHYFWRNYLRELLANVKAAMNLVMSREPKYLGEKIPITAEKASDLNSMR